MSSAEKPLHVQVAEALGWKRTGNCWTLEIPFGKTAVDELPPYGEDTPEGWACTGPLLQESGIELAFDNQPNACEHNKAAGWPKPHYWAARHYNSAVEGCGETACEATARCVVALAAAGKLP